MTTLQTFAVAQQRSISGTITSEDGISLPGVNTRVKGTLNGTSSDINGKYSLLVSNDDVLTFSFIGFHSQEVLVSNQQEINIVLKEDTEKLDEVVIIGYGKQSRASMTNSVSKVKVDDLENITYSSAVSALQGRVAGLRVTASSGQPGAGPSIVLRGGTGGNNNPLYVIDGVIRAEISDLSSSDIASMQVLKDATSTAIYGARGSNGVVIITTKTGSKGKGKISYSYNHGFSTLRDRDDRISGEDYVKYMRLGEYATYQQTGNNGYLGHLDNAYGFGTGNNLTNKTQFSLMPLNSDENSANYNAYKLDEGWKTMNDPLYGNEYIMSKGYIKEGQETLLYQDTNWDDIFFRTASREEHKVELSGGDEKSSYYLGVGYLNEEGITIDTDYERYSLVTNASREVLPGFRVSSKLNFSHSTQQNPAGGSSSNVVSGAHQRNVFQRGRNLAPTAKTYYEDGSPAIGYDRTMPNPLYYNDKFVRDLRKTRWTANIGVDWDILEDLNFSGQASIYNVSTYESSFDKAYISNAKGDINSNRVAMGKNATNWTKQFDGVLTYTKSVNKHNFNLTGVSSYWSEHYHYLQARGQGGANDNTPTLKGVTEPLYMASDLQTDVLIGFAGRLVYDYDKRFLFSASVRRDGSSRFGSEKRWGTYSGVSAGWNMHNESFFKNSLVSNVVDLFKLRASYGETGDQRDLGKYQYQGLYSNSAYDGNGGYYLSTLPNSQLQWETTKTLDLGFDLGLFNRRVNILVDYYHRETTDLLQNLVLPYSTGFSSLKTNLATIGNDGVEVEIDIDIIKDKKFSWNLGLNYSYNKTKYLKLPENGNENNRIGGAEVADPNNPGEYMWVGGSQEGQELGLMAAFVQEGIYASDAEAIADGINDTRAKGLYQLNADGSVNKSLPKMNKGGGDVDWADLDGNGVINNYDRKVMGRSTPLHVGGIINTFNYKSLSLRVNMDYALGHTIYDYDTRYRNGKVTREVSMTSAVTRSWTQQGQVTDVARQYYGDPQGNYNRGNSSLFYKGDYLCIRDITLSYDLPLKWIEKLKLSKATVYVTGQNLYYFTNYPGWQPEKGGTSNDQSTQYPMPRIINFGANITF